MPKMGKFYTKIRHLR